MYIGSLLLDGRSERGLLRQTVPSPLPAGSIIIRCGIYQRCWKTKSAHFALQSRKKKKKYISKTFLIQTLVGPRTKGSLPPSSSIAISKNNIVAPSFLLSFLYLTFVHLGIAAGWLQQDISYLLPLSFFSLLF